MEQTQPPSVGVAAPVVAPKEMLSVRQQGAQTVVKINFSSLDVIQTCKRKAYYSLERGLKNNTEAPATKFGSAIHKGLERWYLRPINERRPVSTRCDGEIPGGRCTCPRCDTVRAFLVKAEPLLKLDMSDKRHPANGIKMLDNYIKKFIDDPFEVLRSPDGKPYVECTLEHPLLDTPALKIILFGTIDAILINVQHNVILVTDHKSTSSLGQEFYRRAKPNHQYSGYAWLVRECLGLPVEAFMINGLQVAKTKTECARQITSRDDADYQEMREAYLTVVDEYLRAQTTGVWAQSAPNACSLWGVCAYHSICETAPALREHVIQSLYTVKESTHVVEHVEA